MKNKFFTAIFLLIATTPCKALLVSGDPLAATNETFSFNVGFAAFDPGAEYSSPRLWMANDDADMGSMADSVKPYGLSLVNQAASYVAPGATLQATPMTNQEPATIFSYSGTSATATSISNPMWGARYHLFSVPMQRPLFVLTNAKNKVYLVEDLQRYETPTAEKPNVTALIEYDFGASEQIHALLGYGPSIVFAAHATGAFGSTTSKIAELSKTSQATNQGAIPYFELAADTEISVSTAALKGGSSGNDLAALGSSIKFSYLFNTFYIALDVTANAAAGSAATALTFATITANGSNVPPAYDFVFHEVIPSAVATAGVPTAISTGAGTQIRLTQIAGMATTTGLSYLIVAQDAGAGSEFVYAIPFIAKGSNAGQIADFRYIQNTFGQSPELFTGREFTTVISNVQDINPVGAYATQLTVGGGELPLASPNLIKQMYTVGDSVYIVIGNDYDTGQKPGTFYSQAIFAQDGHIAGWTPWQRVLGNDQPQNYSYVDRKTLSGYYIAKETTDFNAVNQTTFAYDSVLAPVLQMGPQGTGGYQGLFDFPQSTSGFNNQLSLLIGTGYKTLTIGQTGVVSGGAFRIPTTVNTVTFADSEISGQEAIVAAELAHNGTNHWLFVGGSTGLSVLTNDSGVTWTGNLANVAALDAGQTFKTVGSFTFIKKLVSDSTYLYVLTSNSLYRIALNANKFTTTPTVALNPELILSANSFGQYPSYFLDLIIDTGFCIIGTTSGLYTINLNAGVVAPQKISIPSGLSAASQLLVISSQDQAQRNFKQLSNLIVLNNTFGSQQARINRFLIQNSVITPFDDFLIANPANPTQGVATSLIKFDNYINNYFCDGTWNIASLYFLGLTQPVNNPLTPYVLQIFTGYRTGFSSSHTILPTFSGYAPLSFINGSNLAGFLRESTSGSVMTYGSFFAHANV